MPISIKPFALSTIQTRSYRSHSVHQNVSHCIECSYLGGAQTYHFGFSPVSNERAFIGFERYTPEYIQFYQRPSASTDRTYKRTTHQIFDGETYLVCLNSETKNISVYNDELNLYLSAVYDDFIVEFQEWYAFYDVGSLAISNPNHLQINLGYTKFKNSIPEDRLNVRVDGEVIY